MTIIRSLAMREYHNHRAITNTKLKLFRRSPLLFHRVYNEKSYIIPTTRAMVMGRAIDTLLFDGREEFAKQYTTAPETYENDDGDVKPWHGSANYCKAWARMQAILGKDVLNLTETRSLEWMLNAVRSHPLASALLSQGEAQVTFRSVNETYGMEIQVRPDWFSDKPIISVDLGLDTAGDPYICDLKSVVDFDKVISVLDPLNPRNGEPVYRLGMHRQAGMAQWVVAQDVGRTAHFLIFIERQQPYRVGVVILNGEYLDLGYEDTQADLRRLKSCQVANKWPGSVDRLITLAPPDWLLEKGAREHQANAEAIEGLDRVDPEESLV